MDLEDLRKIREKATRSAFRLETLPQYLVPQEQETFAAWRAGHPKPRTPETSPWLAQLQEDTARGFRWYRVHILDLPLSEYTRYELYSYQASQKAGQETYVVDRSVHADLEHLREDFWLYDDEVAVRMVYDEEGHFLHPELIDDIAPYRQMRDTSMRHGEPLYDYLTRKDITFSA